MREGELAPFGDGAAGERLAELLGEVVAVAAEDVVGLRGELEGQAVQEVVHTERAAEGKDYWMGKGRIVGFDPPVPRRHHGCYFDGVSESSLRHQRGGCPGLDCEDARRVLLRMAKRYFFPPQLNS